MENPIKNPIDHRFLKVTRYHYYFFSLYFLSRFSSMWHILNMLFLSPPMNYTCVISGTSMNESVINMCPCDNPIWDLRVFSKTAQTKFGLYCEKKWLVSFSESIGVFGILMGSFLFGYVSDRFGRLRSFCVSCFIVAVTGCLVSVMPHIAAFIIMRFLEGFGQAGVIVNGYVLCLEYCGLHYRETISALLHIPNNLGHIAIAGISYLIRDCDHFQLAISVPIFLPVFYWFLLQESPKWLLDNNHRDRAIIALGKICKFNKGTDCESIKSEIEAFRPTTAKTEVMKFHHILKYKTLTINLVCMSYSFFICGIGYYGVSQFIGKMSGDFHTNTAIGGSFLVPGTLACMYLLNKLKRKTFLIVTNVVSGSLILIVICIPIHWEPTWIRVMLAGISNSFFYMSFTIVFLYCVELFPTSARNSALGFLSVISRVGQMIAPQINTLSAIPAGCVFGVSAVLCAFVIIPLPETKNTELPSTVDDIQRISHRNLTIQEIPASSKDTIGKKS